MAMDSSTLYKLVILYMLNRVDFPLTNSQISGFFLEKNYTNYFTLQQSLNELIEEDLLTTNSVRNTTYYYVTTEGYETLGYFRNKIPVPIIDDVDTFLMENKYELRNEVGTISDYYRNANQEYIVHCQVKEGKSTLIELNLAVTNREEAELLCNNWKEASQEIYAYVIEQLSR